MLCVCVIVTYVGSVYIAIAFLMEDDLGNYLMSLFLLQLSNMTTLPRIFHKIGYDYYNVWLRTHYKTIFTRNRCKVYWSVFLYL